MKNLRKFTETSQLTFLKNLAGVKGILKGFFGKLLTKFLERVYFILKDADKILKRQ